MRSLTSLLARSKESRSLRAINVLQSKRRRRRLFVEQLEDRRLLATFTVINTDDSGAGSLRQAIVDANSNSGHDEIHFNIAGDGVHTIAPLTGLPNVGDITIDATTQPGFDFLGLHPIELMVKIFSALPFLQVAALRSRA